MLKNYRRIEYVVLCVVIILGASRGMYHLGLLLMHEITNMSYGSGDQAIFFGVGRAMLNGYLPYLDFFESKPPGIFLLTALSLQFSDGALLARIFQSIAIALIPLTLILPLWKEHVTNRLIGTGFALLFGIALAVYTETYAGNLQTESFGAIFGLLYMAFLAILPRPYSRASIVILGASLLFSILFKEPFLFSTLAVALLLLRTKTDLVRGLLLPLVTGGVMGCMLLLLLGLLPVYIQIYVPYMVFEHSAFTEELHKEIVTVPVKFAGFSLIPVVKHLATAPYLLASITFLWGLMIVQIRSLQSFILLACVMFLTLFSINVGGTLGHQAVSAVPIYGAMALWILKNTKNYNFIIFGTVFLAFGFIVNPLPVQGSSVYMEADNALQKAAMTIDTVLHSCGYDRYMNISVTDQVYAYTKHSPLPVGLIAERMLPKLSVALFDKQIHESLQKADVILIRNGDIFSRNMTLYLQNYFTSGSPECAGAFILPEHLELLFRIREHGLSRVSN